MRKRLATLLAALSPDCRASVKFLSAPDAASLSGARRLGLRFHLLLCSFCRRYQAESGRLRQATNALDLSLPRASLTDDARRRIGTVLAHAAGPADHDQSRREGS